MCEEIYDPWYCETISKPISVSFETIIFNCQKGFDIHVHETINSDTKLIIRFKDLPIATRFTNESQRLFTLKGLPNGFVHFINIVRNSNFMSWLNSESLQIYKNDPWIHLCVIADDEWIDIITSDHPEILTERRGQF